METAVGISEGTTEGIIGRFSYEIIALYSHIF